MSDSTVHDITTAKKQKSLTKNPKLSLGAVIIIVGTGLMLEDKVRSLFRKDAKVVSLDTEKNN